MRLMVCLALSIVAIAALHTIAFAQTNNIGCTAVVQVRGNLQSIQRLVNSAPRLDSRVARDRTNALKFQLLNLQLSGPKQVAPRSLTGAMLRALVDVRKAIDAHQAGNISHFTSFLTAARREVSTAWGAWTRYRRAAHC